jgi:type I restriction enzyme M protein
VPVAEIIANGYNLDIKNPNAPEDTHEDPQVLLKKYQAAAQEADQARLALKTNLMVALEGRDG